MGLRIACGAFALLSLIFIRRLIPRGLKLPHPDKIKEAGKKLDEEAESYRQNEKIILESQAQAHEEYLQQVREFKESRQELEEEILRSEKKPRFFLK